MKGSAEHESISRSNESGTRGKDLSQRNENGRGASESSTLSDTASLSSSSTRSAHLFHGMFGHERRRLDYSYHRHYAKERQWMHDSIIETYLDESEGGAGGDDETLSSSGLGQTEEDRAWLILTVGVQGAGKRYVAQHLVEQGRLRLAAPLVRVDPDEIRCCYLPEYACFRCSAQQHEETSDDGGRDDGGRDEDDADDDFDRASLREAGYIAETMTWAALHVGRHVILDGCLRDADWYVQYIEQLRSELPILRVAMIYVTADLETILERAELRSHETGQKPISEGQMRQNYEELPRRVESVRPHVDHFFAIRNGKDAIVLVGKASWDDFSSCFSADSARSTFDRSESLKDRGSVSRQEPRISLLRKSISKKSRRRFSVLQSTEENHKADHERFYGPFSHIRKTLDYSYHSNYTFERQRFQDHIVHEFLGSSVLRDQYGKVCTTPTEPWAVFTAGAMGAGKGYTLKRLVRKGLFPLLAFVRVDPDEIRRHLPEYRLYVQQYPECAGELTRKEAGFISEILTLAGLQSGKNVLIDSSLRDYDWYPRYFARLKDEFPVLRLAILHVTAPPDQVFQRAASRGEKTGRIVPRETLIASIEQVPKSVEILREYVDYFAELDNDSNGEDIELMTNDETWDGFERTWVQTCAWVPDRQKMMRKCEKAKTKHGFDEDGEQDDKLIVL